MNKLELFNLDSLTRNHFTKTTAVRAARVLEKGAEGRTRVNLKSLLRHHGERSVVSPRELRLRSAFDELLGFYSLVEVGCIAGYLPNPLPEEFARAAEKYLSRDEVRKYYEENYPVLLPRLLRKRLAGVNRLRETNTGRSIPLFFQFIENNSMIENENVGQFLWFLEDGRTQGYSIGDTLDALGKPKQFARCLMQAPSERDALDKSLLGFGRFVQFCRHFDSLLQAAHDLPLLQSAMWHFHAYWFHHLEIDFGKSMKDAVRQFEQWDRPKAARETAPTTRSWKTLAEQHDMVDKVAPLSIEKTLSAIRRLTDRQYGRALEESFKTM